jgi:hypothetical protein
MLCEASNEVNNNWALPQINLFFYVEGASHYRTLNEHETPPFFCFGWFPSFIVVSTVSWGMHCENCKIEGCCRAYAAFQRKSWR